MAYGWHEVQPASGRRARIGLSAAAFAFLAMLNVSPDFAAWAWYWSKRPLGIERPSSSISVHKILSRERKAVIDPLKESRTAPRSFHEFLADLDAPAQEIASGRLCPNWSFPFRFGQS